MSQAVGTRCDGVRTFSDLRARCDVDAVTDCWRWRQGRNDDDRPRLWCPVLHRCATLGSVICVLRTGAPPRWDEVWACTCSTRDCANPLHRERRTKSQHQQMMAQRPATTFRRAHIAAGRRVDSKLSDDAVQDIRTSGELLRIVAARHGISVPYASRIRLGQARRALAGWGSSVFNLGAPV